MINKTGKKIREWQKKIELEQGSIGTQETKKAEQNRTKLKKIYRKAQNRKDQSIIEKNNRERMQKIEEKKHRKRSGTKRTVN